MLKWFKKTKRVPASYIDYLAQNGNIDKEQYKKIKKMPYAEQKDNTWVVVDQSILKAPDKKDKEVK